MEDGPVEMREVLSTPAEVIRMQRRVAAMVAVLSRLVGVTLA